MDVREIISALLGFQAAVDKFSAAVDKLNAGEAVTVGRDAAVLAEVEGATAMSTKPETGGVTLAEVEDAIIQVKNKRGSSPANQILKKVAGTTSLKKIDAALYEQIVAECDAALKDAADPEPKREEVKPEEPKQEAAAPETQEPQASESGPTLSRADMEAELKAAAKSSDEVFDRIKELIKTVGGAPNMRMLTDEGLAAVYAAFKADEEDEL
jgi:hypothetical protein